jgi:hypothetical protein
MRGIRKAVKGRSQSAPAQLKLPERATAVALLLLLHAALFFLINPKFGPKTELQPLSEITLSFNAPKPRDMALPAVNPVFLKPAPPAIAPPIIPESNLPPPPAMATPNVTGIGRSLFSCDLANTNNLSREDRANCGRLGPAPPPTGTMEAGMPKTSKAKHGALWAAELAARRAPVRVPCTGIVQQVLGGPGAQKQVSAIMADPLCLLDGLWNGFQPRVK